MNNSKNYLPIPVLLVIVWFAWLVPAAFPQQPSIPTSSAKSSPTPAIHAVRIDAFAACAAAVDDLVATRQLAAALDVENAALKKRLDLEKQSTELLRELNDTHKSENAALAEAISAKNQTIAAKDAVIATQDKLIGLLKQKKPSPWRRLGDILIGAAVAAALR